MGYNTHVTGAIMISPPLNAKELRNWCGLTVLRKT